MLKIQPEIDGKMVILKEELPRITDKDSSVRIYVIIHSSFQSTNLLKRRSKSAYIPYNRSGTFHCFVSFRSSVFAL